MNEGEGEGEQATHDLHALGARAKTVVVDKTKGQRQGQTALGYRQELGQEVFAFASVRASSPTLWKAFLLSVPLHALPTRPPPRHAESHTPRHIILTPARTRTDPRHHPHPHPTEPPARNVSSSKEGTTTHQPHGPTPR